MQSTPLFIDGVGNISLVDGVVRMDLVELAPGQAGKPTPTKIGSLAMTLPGFLRTADQVNQVLNKLVEQGVLKRNEPNAAETSAKA